MPHIISKITINSPVKKVWRIISAVDRDPRFWKRITGIQNVLREGNVLTRDVSLYNLDMHHQRIILFPIEGIHIRWTGESSDGIKDIMLSQVGDRTVLEIETDYTLKGAARLRATGISDEIAKESELALQMIKDEVEKPQQAVSEEKTYRDVIS